MEKVFNFIRKWVWCLPQTLAALIYKKIVKINSVEVRKTYQHPNGIYIYKKTPESKMGSVSLGDSIFLHESHWNDEDVIAHEMGHCKQSDILGPLYLLVIGLPSFIWCTVIYPFMFVVLKKDVSYYSFYTEKWADKLGGINRVR